MGHWSFLPGGVSASYSTRKADPLCGGFVAESIACGRRSVLPTDDPIDDVRNTLFPENQTDDSRHFCPHMSHLVFGDGSFSAVFSRFASGAVPLSDRAAPLGDFTRCRNFPHRVTRSPQDWDAALIDFILRGTRILRIAENAIRCKIPSLRLRPRLSVRLTLRRAGALYKGVAQFQAEGSG